MSNTKSHWYLHLSFEPPEGVLSQLLPDRQLLVLQFLTFKFPATTTVKSTFDPEDFFYSDQPSVHDTRDIKDMPIPPPKHFRCLSSRAFNHYMKEHTL
ncbi:hypothetical protein P692DRAFT_201718147 [Suillus brevipes Sb2]|nr:hypothetical protein P692DRAFT_201718147 [Suillus brevipes Sb2]